MFSVNYIIIIIIITIIIQYQLYYSKEKEDITNYLSLFYTQNKINEEQSFGISDYFEQLFTYYLYFCGFIKYNNNHSDCWIETFDNRVEVLNEHSYFL